MAVTPLPERLTERVEQIDGTRHLLVLGISERRWHRQRLVGIGRIRIGEQRQPVGNLLGRLGLDHQRLRKREPGRMLRVAMTEEADPGFRPVRVDVDVPELLGLQVVVQLALRAEVVAVGPPRIGTPVVLAAVIDLAVDRRTRTPGHPAGRLSATIRRRRAADGR